MEILLPKKSNGSPGEKLSSRTVTVIGANGAGKSSFGVEIARQIKEHAFWLSAQKALCLMPPHEVWPGSIEAQYKEAIDRSHYVSKETPTEFDQLLFLLLSEEFRNLFSYKFEVQKGGHVDLPKTRLDRVQRLWERIFPKNKMLRAEGKLLIQSEDSEPFNPLRLSSGEKAVFYYIAGVLYAMPDAVILVEDPEFYLHHSILKSLWDSIESLRKDCTFIYLTHDIDFAASRVESTCIWVRSFDAEHLTWDYEFIHDDDSFPEGMYLDILGSRKPVLFIEGANTGSIDVKLYPYIFPEYIVKPLGGCNKVIEATRAFADLKEIHHLESRGIVDRDRRTEREVEYLRSRHIYVPEVAEVENLLMLEGVIRAVARRMKRNENKVVEIVKNNVIQLFAQEIESQALLHTRHRIRRNLEYKIDRRFNDIASFEDHIDHLTDDTDVRGLYNSICSQFRSFVKNRDYRSVLKVYNQKSMVTNSNVCNLCGLANKDKYLRVILSILRDDRPEAESIRSAIRACFKIDKTEENEAKEEKKNE